MFVPLSSFYALRIQIGVIETHVHRTMQSTRETISFTPLNIHRSHRRRYVQMTWMRIADIIDKTIDFQMKCKFLFHLKPFTLLSKLISLLFSLCQFSHLQHFRHFPWRVLLEHQLDGRQHEPKIVNNINHTMLPAKQKPK